MKAYRYFVQRKFSTKELFIRFEKIDYSFEEYSIKNRLILGILYK